MLTFRCDKQQHHIYGTLQRARLVDSSMTACLALAYPNLHSAVPVFEGACSTSQEFLKHEQQPDKHIKQYSSFNPRTQQHFEIDVGYERFMGPEVTINAVAVVVLCVTGAQRTVQVLLVTGFLLHESPAYLLHCVLCCAN